MQKRKPAGVRKLEIIEAALRLADTLGPDRITTEAIARAVGLTQPGVFRHFPKKQDIWRAVVAHIATEMDARWAEVQRRNGTAADRVRALVAVQLRIILSMPAITAILFSRELHAESDILRRDMLDLMGRFHQLVARNLLEARAAGDLRDTLDCNDAAFLLIGLIHSLAVRWSLSGRPFDLAGEGSRLLDLQLTGFGHLTSVAVTHRISV